jgi:hypothetical protein
MRTPQQRPQVHEQFRDFQGYLQLRHQFGGNIVLLRIKPPSDRVFPSL